MRFRLFDRQSQAHVIVDGDRVYASTNGSGRICSNDDTTAEPLGARRQALVDAARHFEQYFDPRVPGVASLDSTIVSGASLNAAEEREFTSAAGTLAQRSHLAHHLSFFDSRNVGTIDLGDNYRGWRALGFGVLRSVVQAVSSAVIFGRGSSIVIARIGRVRPAGATGIYDANGQIDENTWAGLRAALEPIAKNGVLTQSEALHVIEHQVRLGAVPRRQFGSLFRVCERMNRAKTITIDEIRWLYDGSLLYRAASMTSDRGRRTL